MGDNINQGKKTTTEYYDALWSPKKNRDFEREKIVMPAGFHWGLFEKGIKTMREAMTNMNEYVGKLLEINQYEPKQILDAGCGMGTTSLQLARKYPKVTFTGVTLAQNEVLLAKKYSKRLDIKNVNFLKRSFLKTGFSDNCFDGVFALESFSYTNNKKEFVNEMYRILKPGGKLVIIDGFRKPMRPDSSFYKLYNFHCKKRGGGNLSIKKNFMSQLKSKGFQNFYSKDLSKNITKNFLVRFFDSAPVILKSIIRLNKTKKYGKKQGNTYNHNLVFLDCFFGLLKISTYDVIIAEKPQ